jgi:hypothetical protein
MKNRAEKQNQKVPGLHKRQFSPGTVKTWSLRKKLRRQVDLVFLGVKTAIRGLKQAKKRV